MQKPEEDTLESNMNQLSQQLTDLVIDDSSVESFDEINQNHDSVYPNKTFSWNYELEPITNLRKKKIDLLHNPRYPINFDTHHGNFRLIKNQYFPKMISTYEFPTNKTENNKKAMETISTTGPKIYPVYNSPKAFSYRKKNSKYNKNEIDLKRDNSNILVSIENLGIGPKVDQDNFELKLRKRLNLLYTYLNELCNERILTACELNFNDNFGEKDYKAPKHWSVLQNITLLHNNVLIEYEYNEKFVRYFRIEHDENNFLIEPCCFFIIELLQFVKRFQSIRLNVDYELDFKSDQMMLFYQALKEMIDLTRNFIMVFIVLKNTIKEQKAPNLGNKRCRMIGAST